MQLLQRLSTCLLVIYFIAGCASLPEKMEYPTEEKVIPLSSSLLNLGNTYQPSKNQENMSALLLQKTGWDALAQRLALVESAEHSIDIQYYIWNSDTSGNYLASRLMAAANRGVKVRIMLDDINLNERENLLAAIDHHPNVEIRIFNPTPSRHGLAKWISFLGDFSRLNRRMHNKSLTVDGVFSVVGGRNIGDEYFDLSDEINFRDRDVLVMGTAVSEIQTSFVDYWNSQWSYPIDMLTDGTSAATPTWDNIPVPHYKHYPELPAGKQSSILLLKNLMGKMIWAKAHFVYDRPVPINSDDTDTPKKTAKLLAEIASQSQQEIILESAYLIFNDHQLAGLQNLSKEGIQVKALTNSMASNDLVTNHSGYAGRRQEMLEQGMQLFELKPDTKLCELSTKDESKCAPTIGYGLHAKSSVFDRKIAIIGSFNFNLRSTYLNTESLLIIENEEVANILANDIEQAMNNKNSWQLSLHEGDIHWSSDNGTWESEPETEQWERIKSGFLKLLPIEKYL